MSINVNDKNLGHATAYAYYKAGGGTMTEAEFTEFMADFGTASQTAVEAAQAALASKNAAQTAATTATNKASEATTAAQIATTKAGEASASASTATSAKDTAVSASQTATSKATEATTAATTATSAKTDAVAANTAAQSAKTAAQTAQTGAETAAASVEASSAQITKNATDINELKSDLTAIESDGVVPSAEQILTDKGVTDSVPYHYRKTGGDGADRLYDKIVGGSLAVNQLINIPDGTTTAYGVTFSVSNGVVTYSGTVADNAPSYLEIFSTNDTSRIVAGHKYVMLVNDTNKPTLTARYGYWLANNPYTECPYPASTLTSRMYAPTAQSTYIICRLSIGDKQGQTISGKVSFNLIDLTQMFGTTIADYVYSLETATVGAGVEWLKAHFPRIFDAGCVPYNAGELVSVQASAHKMTGFNQWDEEWELASIDWSTRMFTPTVNGGRLSSKNYIQVLPNTTYYINRYNENYIAGYDSDNPTNGYVINNVAGSFTTPSNCHFIKFGVLTDNYGKTYKNDICINISDPTRNGEYEPYKAHSYPLDSTVELRGLFKLDANNNLYADGDTYDADGKVTRRYGIYVFTGNETWSAGSTTRRFTLTMNNIAAQSAVANAEQNVFSSKYGRFKYANADKIAYINTTAGARSIVINDSSLSTVSECKAAFAGSVLVYELATPTTEEAEPYQHLQQCDSSGTEEYVSTGIVPVGHNSFYPENLKAKIEGLPWNFANLIAPTESAFVATRNYVTGDLFIVNNVLYKATSNIANGGAITPNTNCTATTLAEIISALAQ